MRRAPATLLAGVVTITSLVGCGDDERGLEPLGTPTFEAEDGTGDGTAAGVPADDRSGPGPTSTGGPESLDPSAGSPAGPTGLPVPPTTTPPIPIERVEFDDAIGDATPGVGTGSPPAWTDLAGGSLERRGDAYRLTVRLGGDAPTRSTGADTMNIASFYDVDGDGSVEFEIWVNLGPEGWGPVWYDDKGNAAPGESSNVTVVVQGDEVSLLFPDVLLGAPDRLRFSVASEYGELSTIGSSFARRDDAPDGDRAVGFPN